MEQGLTNGASVRVIHGPDAESIQRCVEIGRRLTIGRRAAELRVADGAMSREHAEITHDANGFCLTLLTRRRDSSWHQGRPSRDRVRLRNGDLIRLGETLLVFRAGRMAVGPTLSDLPGQAPAAHELRQQVVARADAADPILIEGEPGTERRHVVKALHACWQRTGRIIRVDCRAPDAGARLVRLLHVPNGEHGGVGGPGSEHSASQSTVWLDDIGELPLDAQLSLINALERESFWRDTPRPATPRPRLVATAAIGSLEVGVQLGGFRRDLLDRLRRDGIEVPPLRERVEDLIEWIERLTPVPRARLTAGAVELLALHPWPENLRQLKQVIGEAEEAAGADVISPRHLPGALRLLRLLAADRLDDAGRSDPPATASEADEAILAAWRRLVVQDCEELPLLFGPDQPWLLDEVYVEPDLTLRSMSSTHSGPVDDETLTIAALMAPEGACRWLLLGEAGAGKTLLARHLAAELARGGAADAIPVLASLAELDANERHPFDDAEERLCHAIGSDGQGLARLLRARSSPRGRVWLFLDGLDEVPAGRRDRMLRRIDEWRRHQPGAGVLVFTRPFSGLQLARFESAWLRPIDATRRKRVLGRWLGEAAARSLSDRIEACPSLARLARNALGLSLLARLSREGGLPPSPVRLYGKALSILCGDAARPGRAAGLSLPARRLLAAVSFALHHGSAESWDDRDLRRELDLIAHGEEPDLRTDLAMYRSYDALLDEWGRGCGAFGVHDRRRGRWRYMHPAMRACLAAEYLADPTRSGSRWACLPADFREDGRRWGLVVAFLCEWATDPRARLEAIRVDDGLDLALWALPELGLDFEDALRLFERWVGEADPAPFGEHLRRLVENTPERESAESAIVARLSARPSVEWLALLHYVVRANALGIDDARFFAEAGRPMTSADDATAVVGGWLPGVCQPASLGSRGRRGAGEVTAVGLMAGPVTFADYGRFEDRCREGTRAPLTGVSWYVASLYAAWMGCRLPTEAEMRCAQGGAGDDGDAWHGDDLLEWCADWFVRDAVPQGCGPDGPEEGVERVVCRGPIDGWLPQAPERRRSRRPHERSHDVGFRLARSTRPTPSGRLD